MEHLFTVCLLVVLSVVGTQGQRQTATDCLQHSKGRHFVVSFAQIYGHYFDNGTLAPTSISLRVSSTSFGRVTVEASSSSGKTQSIVDSFVLDHVEIPINTSYLALPGIHDDKTIIVKSSVDISLTALYSFPDSEVPTAVLPTSSLGRNYTAAMMKPNTYFSNSSANILVIATADSQTTVTFSDGGTSTHQTLSKYQTFLFSCSSDKSGIQITSNNPVAVFTSVGSGYDTLYSFFNVKYKYNHTHSMFAQNLPKDHTTTHYIVMPVFDKESTLRIYAMEDDTRVSFKNIANLQNIHVYKEIYYETVIKDRIAMEIVSTKPILVTQAPSSSETMFFVQAESQYMSEYAVYGATRAVIIVQTDEASGILLDTTPLAHNPELQASHHVNNYTILSTELDGKRSHVISHVGNIPFGLLILKRFPDGSNPIKNAFAYSPGFKVHLQECSGLPIIG
ncbi:uncharacterized protein LOC127879380 [Dreissena polymorpha]|uniref:IgGFc-binding protein N-terminal domain-containing protein n=1 Tax=Dreissena polymorpha TaxID=45954 RepID=A0A9D4KI38_DREPO|nr:uncharacterized protein LOC127879380 [Dreissena polymorpha]KAH3839652.1 hypothetical protein DPMN_113084 [Dreissena polymorpha]